MKKKLNFILGLILGVALVTTTGAAASAAIQATLSNHPVRINGEYVDIQGYLINGNNHYKLRDLGKLLGFDVEWDQSAGCVSITTTGNAPVKDAVKVEAGTVSTVDRYIPAIGDVITCKDGYRYEITDVSRWNKSMFAKDDTNELPEPTCDWSLLPQPELPAEEARHFTAGGKEYLFMRNLYETRRMQYTLYNAIGDNPQTWVNGRPATMANGNPLVRINLSIPDDVKAFSFWPWRSNQITDLFNSCPPGEYSVEAWDVYCNGAFRYTEYYIHVK